MILLVSLYGEIAFNEITDVNLILITEVEHCLSPMCFFGIGAYRLGLDSTIYL